MNKFGTRLRSLQRLFLHCTFTTDITYTELLGHKARVKVITNSQESIQLNNRLFYRQTSTHMLPGKELKSGALSSVSGVSSPLTGSVAAHARG